MGSVFIFLDVDGVLNSFKHPGKVKNSFGLSKIHLRNFFILRDAFDAKVVLSSAWRLSEKRVKELKDAGLDILDRTPLHLESREEEILCWKNKHMSNEDWGIILDDEKVLTKPVSHLVEFYTTLESGLLLKDVRQFINTQKYLQS